MKTFLVGYYRVEGVGTVQAEVPLSGPPHELYDALAEKIARAHPGRKFERLSSEVEARGSGKPTAIEYHPGQTLRQLFPVQPEDAAQDSLLVGSVFFEGSPCDMTLRYLRGQNTIKVVLRARIGGSVSHLPFQFSAGHAVEELKTLLTNAFKGDVRDIKLSIQPQQPNKNENITKS